VLFCVHGDSHSRNKVTPNCGLYGRDSILDRGVRSDSGDYLPPVQWYSLSDEGLLMGFKGKLPLAIRF